MQIKRSICPGPSLTGFQFWNYFILENLLMLVKKVNWNIDIYNMFEMYLFSITIFHYPLPPHVNCLSLVSIYLLNFRGEPGLF